MTGAILMVSGRVPITVMTFKLILPSLKNTLLTRRHVQNNLYGAALINVEPDPNEKLFVKPLLTNQAGPVSPTTICRLPFHVSLPGFGQAMSEPYPSLQARRNNILNS